MLNSSRQLRFSKIEHYLAFIHSVESLLKRTKLAQRFSIIKEMFAERRPQLNDFTEKSGIGRCGSQLLGQLGMLNSAYHRYFAKIEHY